MTESANDAVSSDAVPSDAVSFDVVSPTSDDAQYAMNAYFEELDERFRAGFDRGDGGVDNDAALTEAIAMYGRCGYEAIERYNDNPYADHWFAKSLDH